MLKLHRKVSRTAYRKIKNQKSQPNYLQQILSKQKGIKQSDIQRLFQEMNMSHIPEYQDRTNPAQIIQIQPDQQIKQEIEDQIDKINLYFSLFTNNNLIKNANKKVERERLRIQKQNYIEIANKGQEKLKQLVQQLYNLWINLQNKYKQGHQYYLNIGLKNQEKRVHQRNKKSRLKQITENQQIINQQIYDDDTNQKMGIQTQNEQKCIQILKQKQHQLQIQIKIIQNKVKQQIKCRNYFILQLLSKGFYQQNGLIWILQQITKFQQLDQQRCIKFQNVVDQTRGKQFYNPFSVQPLKLTLKVQHFPSVLDIKSKNYMLKIYESIKDDKQKVIKKSSQLKQRINAQKRIQLENSKVYIADNQSSIFPHSKAKAEFQQNAEKQKQHQIPIVMVRKTHNGILQKSNITDIAKSMEVHTKPEKYNYDIKNIYANTRQSLQKWIKGICKQVAYQNAINHQPNQKNKVDTSFHIADRADTQIYVHSRISTHKFKKSNQKKITESLVKLSESKLSKINIKTNKQSNQIENRGYSLPLIKTKADKILPFNSNSRYQNRTEKNNLQKSLIKNEIKTDLSTLNQTNQEKESKLSIDKSKKQKIRILRIYPKQTHQKVIKYMFGIKDNIEEMYNLLYQ